MASLSDRLPSFGVAEVLDVVVVAILIYILLRALQQTRTTFLIPGLAILTGAYVVAVTLRLRLTGSMFDLLFTVFLVGLIVVFHEEIRVSVERFLSWQSRKRRGKTPVDPASWRIADALIGTITDLARDRIGALIVIRAKDDPTRFIRGGSTLDGIVSAPLLKSIFDPHSIGHDGAALISHDRIARFGCHLPLSTNAEQIGDRGTRHAAALGLAEKTDCLCLVVSEERGTVSAARRGRLDVLDGLSDLTRVLDELWHELGPERRPSFLGRALWRHMGLKAAALVIAIILWVIVVHESITEYRSYMLPLESVGLNENLAVTSSDPAQIRLIVSGPHRSFYLRRDDELRVDLKLFERGTGTHDLILTATDVALPDDLTFVNLVPRLVRVTIEERPK